MNRTALALLLCLLALPAWAQSAPVLLPAGCGTGNITSGIPYTTVNSTGQFCITGTFAATLGGFAPASQGTPVAATTGGNTQTLPAGAVVVATNVGATNAAYCKLGASADTGSQYIAPNGGWFSFTVGAATQLTCVTSTSTTTVNTIGGAGLATGTGGGSGGGGGGGAITAASGAIASGAYSAGSLAAGAGVDGWDLTQGAKADAAWVSGSGSVIAILKNLAAGIANGVGTFGSAMPVTGLAPGLYDGTNLVRSKGDETSGAFVQTRAHATGGATLSSAIAPATPAGVSLKASAGTLFRLPSTTIQATPVYIKFYDTASAPTCGSGTPKARFMIPVASTAANGAGNNVDLGDIGVAFTTGIGYCVTGALADADTTAITANNTLVNIVWN